MVYALKRIQVLSLVTNILNYSSVPNEFSVMLIMRFTKGVEIESSTIMEILGKCK